MTELELYTKLGNISNGNRYDLWQGKRGFTLWVQEPPVMDGLLIAMVDYPNHKPVINYIDEAWLDKLSIIRQFAKDLNV